MGDVCLPNGTILVASGKGQKSRTLYPPPECLEAVQEWISIRGECSHEWLWAESKARRAGWATARGLLENVKTIAGLAGNSCD